MLRAAIDIGTHSVRLLVAEITGGRVVPVLRRMEITRLGEGLDDALILAPQAIGRTVRAVREFFDQARAAGARRVVVFGTSAVREARNRATLERDLSPICLRVLTGTQEADLAFRGVVAGLDGLPQPALVVDVGGGSTELVLGTREAVRSRVSLPLGAVRLTERFCRSDPVADVEAEALCRTVSAALRPHRSTFAGAAQAVGVGGTVTSLAAIDQGLDPYDPQRVHGYRIPASRLASIARGLCAMPLALRRRLPGLQPQRAEVICAGALIVQTVLEEIGLPDIVASEADLLWGALLEL
ncbi:MAG: Ppx/GppA phosphatase family protein [Armatimonadota bacterium]|nr:Ppx/GppA phosphatase family protein [Armatimonadota bacterium]